MPGPSGAMNRFGGMSYSIQFWPSELSKGFVLLVRHTVIAAKNDVLGTRVISMLAEGIPRIFIILATAVSGVVTTECLE